MNWENKKKNIKEENVNLASQDNVLKESETRRASIEK